MVSIQTIFKRVEKKYILNEVQYLNLLNILKCYVIEDNYSNYVVKNIYYDNENFDLINRSLEKPVFKEKLRLRSYDGKKVFFELKKKFKKEVFKRRIILEKEDFENNNFTGVKNKQILKEIEYFKNKHDLVKKMVINYERKAFKGIEDSEVRITFDHSLKYRTTNLNFDYEKDLIEINKDKYIMEIKVNGAMPLWLVDILTKNKIYPHTFSKYGNCYKNYLNNDRKEV